jgi:8-oxo-dGTP diphosphatase
MAICINKNGDIFEEFINISGNEVRQENYKYPITHALVVVKNKNRYLLVYNIWRNNWELAGGMMENGETMRECAMRELNEETNQIAKEMEFKGLMKFKLKNGKTEYGGLFSARIEKERPFIKNEETNKITFGNGEEDIGYINEIDKKLLEYY